MLTELISTARNSFYRYVSLLLLLFVGASQNFAQTSAPFAGTTISPDCKQWVDAQMAKMTLEAKVGQLIVTTLPARADNETKAQVKNLVKKYQIGGLLFSEGTVEGQALLTNLAQKTTKVPLMVTFDGEWGLAMRLKGMPNFPRNVALGSIQDLSLIEAYGYEVAKEMRQLGVTVNFAPVADVNTNPKNPVIHERSFGENPAQVSACVLAYCRGLERGGVLAVGKHFPGHGDSMNDSHLTLPVLNHNRERLDSVELYPFREMIKAGHGGLMVGHLKVPALDASGTPSSLSKPIVENLLRSEMGFKGLLFTDALDMKGVTMESQRYLKAIQAGNDMLLVQYDTQKAVGQLLQAVNEGKLSRETIDQHCRQVLTYKYLLGLSARQAPIAVAGLAERICSDEAQQLASRLRQAGVTVLTNHFNVLPLPTDKGKIAVVGYGEAGADSAFVAALSKEREVAYFHLPRQADASAQAALVKQLASYRRVVVCVTGSHLVHNKDAAFLASLRPKAPLVYLLFTSYRVMKPLEGALKQAASVVLAHSGETDLQAYVARLLVAKERADGRFSMSMMPLYAHGLGCTLEKQILPPAIFPDDLGMQAQILTELDGLARQGVEEKAYAGCRLLVIKNGQPIVNEGYGVHSPKDPTAVRPTDLFDVAGITRTAATLLAVMKLYDTGKLKLDVKISTYLPKLAASTKRNLTVRQLLFHESGLPAYERYYLEAIDPNSVHGPYMQSWVDQWHHTQVSEHSYWCSDFRFKKGLSSVTPTANHTLQVADSLWFNKSFGQQIIQKVINAPLNGVRYVDSDMGFILLQQVVEKLAGMPLNAYVEREFYRPMELERTLFLPLSRYAKSEIMPSTFNDFLRRRDLCGFVHDEAAACMGGVAGHAGLFTTAEELGRIYQMLLDGGVYKGKRLLSEATCQLFIQTKSDISRRGLGFDHPDPKNPKQSACLSTAPQSTFGHAGFTGTAVWADPQNKLIFIFLSNRLCPNVWSTKLGDLHLIQKMQQTIYDSLYEN